MEECEALCTRLVIMVNGEFKCLGSPQHLKLKFGNGYKLAIRLNSEKETENLFNFMKTNFPTSTLNEIHKNLIEFTLPFRDTKLSKLFGKMEQNRINLNIQDYTVSQTTLDQIFVDFAKAQEDDGLFIARSTTNNYLLETFNNANINYSQANGNTTASNGHVQSNQQNGSLKRVDSISMLLVY